MTLIERLRVLADDLACDEEDAELIQAAIARIEAADVLLRHEWVGAHGHETPKRPQEMMLDCLELALLAGAQDRALVREQDKGENDA